MPGRVLESLRGAMQALWRRPRFALGAVALLAATLFALALVVSLFAAVVLRPLPFRDPQALVALHATVQREVRERREFSRPDFLDYRAALRGATDVAGWEFYSATLRGLGAARVTPGEVVDANYFDTLGVAPALGRAFAPQRREDAVLISHTLWQERFGGESAALGRSVSIDGRSYTVIGVMPERFAGLTGTADIWLPFDAPSLLPAALVDNRFNRWHGGVARLLPGSDVASLNRELDGIGARLAESYPDSNRNYSAQATPLREELMGEQARAIEAVASGVLLLLAIAVMNLGGLALVRANARGLEHAMRRCLGASPARLFADMVAEGVVIGAVAGALASAAAALALPQLARWVPIALPSFVSAGMTVGVASAMVGAGMFGGSVAFAIGGLVARRARLQSLRAGARSTRQHGTLRRALVGGEIALGVALLVAALLLARSFAAIGAIDPGYRVEDMLVMNFELPQDRYDSAAAMDFGRRLVQVAQRTPGVESAALGSDSPLSADWSANVIVSDRLEETPTRVYRHGVMPEFFDTAGIVIESGSSFPRDLAADGEALAVVSSALAKKLWPGQDAIGKRLKRGAADSTNPWMRVVGVARDTRWRGLPFGPTQDPDYYYALPQAPATAYALLLHTRDTSAAMVQRLSESLRSLDPEVPVYATQTMRERVRTAMQIPGFLAALGLFFALVALLLAALGVYAIAAMDAGQRLRELAIRQAVGADAPALARLFLGEYGRVFGVAMLLGLATLLPLSGLLQDRLFGVSVVDPWSLFGATSLFATALLLGIAAPLRRVLAVQPAVLMRGE